MANKLKDYENNPFYVGLHGLNTVFDKAKGVSILLVVVSVLSFLSGAPGQPQDKDEFKNFALPSLSPEQWALIGLGASFIFLAAIAVGSMISGMSAYASARVARGHDVKLGEAFQAVLDRLFSYIWLQIITIVKILLWSLLLIVPGIIMSVRYSLANVAFFDKELRGNAAIKESLKLTRGAWLTTYASQALFNIVTLGIISELVQSGARAVLYRQLSVFGEKTKKPDAHILSWLTLFLPFIAAILVLALIAMLLLLFVTARTIAG